MRCNFEQGLTEFQECLSRKMDPVAAALLVGLCAIGDAIERGLQTGGYQQNLAEVLRDAFHTGEGGSIGRSLSRLSGMLHNPVDLRLVSSVPLQVQGAVPAVPAKSSPGPAPA